MGLDVDDYVGSPSIGFMGERVRVGWGRREVFFESRCSECLQLLT